MQGPMKNSSLRAMIHFALSRIGRRDSAKTYARIAGVAACLIFPALAYGATDDIWKTPTTVNWSLPGNWSTGFVPGSNDVVRYDNLSNATLNTNQDIPNLSISGIVQTSAGA